MVLDDLFRDIKSKAGAALGLLRCEIRIENLMQLAGRDTSAIVFHAKIDIKIFLGAGDCDNTAFVRTGLNGIDDHILNRAIQLQGISQEDARVVTNRHSESYSLLIRHGCKAFEDFPQRTRNGDGLRR